MILLYEFSAVESMHYWDYFNVPVPVRAASRAQTRDSDQPDSTQGGKLLGLSVIGEMASELVHIGMACLHFGGGVDYFIESVFNYPTLSDVYKYAAFDALAQLNKLRGDAPAAPIGYDKMVSH